MKEENYYAELIHDYMNKPDETTIRSLQYLVKDRMLTGFTVMEHKLQYRFRDDDFLMRAIIVLIENDFIGHIKEQCEVVNVPEGYLIRSKILNKILLVEDDVEMHSVELNYHKGVSDILFMNGVKKCEDGVLRSRCLYLVEEDNIMINRYTYDSKSGVHDVSDEPRYMRCFLFT